LEEKIKYPIVVYLEWRDAHGYPEWIVIDDLNKDCIMKTSGFLMEENDKFTTITQTISPEDKLAHTIKIPAKEIIKIRKLK